MRRAVFVGRRSFQMKTVISVEEATRRVTATYPLKRDATKKPLHPIVSMLARDKKGENPQTVPPLLVLHFATSTLW